MKRIIIKNKFIKNNRKIHLKIAKVRNLLILINLTKKLYETLFYQLNSFIISKYINIH